MHFVKYDGFDIVIDANRHLPQFVVSDFENADTSHTEAYEIWPWGSARKIVPKGSTINLQEWLQDSLRLLPNYTVGMRLCQIGLGS